MLINLFVTSNLLFEKGELKWNTILHTTIAAYQNMKFQ